MKWWAVDVDGFMSHYFQAETGRKARYLAFRVLRECGYVSTFRDFLARLGGTREASADEAAVWS